ncbi:Vacuolar protein sorting-associated protein 41 [Puccinia graminis f. sp. tritici]|uniref:Vacuolar protein sorting-associated protein 41 n=1 Tax=Puccinia graminis f. sp. tritici TaxID=56615 RepID=A0A5B0Q9D5_PUCGR|nr:Vacuolar protein sorting-associated protein 41 [Puccinia graminis f. sp. tritici]
MEEERESGEVENMDRPQEAVVDLENSRPDQALDQLPSVSALIEETGQEEAIAIPQETKQIPPGNDQEPSSDNVSVRSSGSSIPEDQDEEDDEEGEEEEEEEEEEPLFKYQRLEGHIDKLFQNDNASALTTSEKHIGLGTHNGVVYILNHRIELIKRFRPHSATIYDIKIEVSEQFVATASMDGKISIVQLSGGNDVFILDLKRPMMAVAMEPLYHKHPNKRQFISGGLAGNLTLHEKGWLGNKETVLHSNEGSIWSAEWKNNLVVWANDTGIRIIDINTHQKVAYIPRGADEPRADLYRCHFSWSTPEKLLVGWADTIRVVSIKENSAPTSIHRGLIPTSSTSSPNLSVKVEMVFQVDCIISGICAWEAGGSPDIAILAHTSEPEDSDVDITGNERPPSDDGIADSIAPRSSKRRPAQRPELRIISSNGEEISSDALNINSFQRYQPNDYCLCYLLPPSESGKKKKMDDESLYVMSPKDLILVELRNRSDHISWMIDHENYEGAMKEVEEAGLAGAHGYSLSEIGQKYLNHLISQGQFQVAANASPSILANDVKAWEDWIFMLTEEGQLDVIIPHVPTEAPRLSKVVYEIILVHLLRSNTQVARVIAQLADHRRYQFMYLDALFEVDPSLGTDYGDLHVDLFAEFDRQRLMKFLRASTFYDLEKAYQICQDLNFVPEMVYLLGRMGNNKKALFLIIDRIGDVHRAIEFAKEQNDDDLWEDLLRYSETRPAFIRGLLDNVGSEIDPIRLIRRIQNGLEIPDLKASIIKILQDFHLQISLIEGCRSIMVSDCRDLSKVYYASQTLGALGDPSLRCQKCNRLLTEPSKPVAATDDGTELVADNSIAMMGSALSIMFLCRHSFHSLCVFDSNTVLAALAEQQLDRSRSALGDAIVDRAGERYNAINLKFAQTLILRSGDGSCPICTSGSKKSFLSHPN